MVIAIAQISLPRGSAQSIADSDARLSSAPRDGRCCRSTPRETVGQPRCQEAARTPQPRARRVNVHCKIATCSQLTATRVARSPPKQRRRSVQRLATRNEWSSPHAKRPLVVSESRSQEKKLFCPRPAAQGRHATPLPTRARPARKPRRSGRFRRLGRAAGSVRAPASLPLRPRTVVAVCLRHGLRPARFAVCLRQRAQPAAYAHPRPVARQPFGAPGPRVTPSQRLQRPALWGIRACVFRLARVAARRPWAAGGGRPVGAPQPVTAWHRLPQALHQPRRTSGSRPPGGRKPLRRRDTRH